ncbi:Bax inhibitor-1/YccA family protein [Flavobacterium alkalisoli]|uniref:Bax inhibitor-1/YccA family protein n=1 Tax=Flavobacterium alkalisoli TaxID=2602769 RepID=A0A5B9FNP0_9FLAO|nr:Bax inhibitor-1/YccA family protein [Flavobacterium alkalisoli]QEE48913.1 Bax inhibitor-1/YccA family protein [Flavobacterium alkalisoli]
MNLKSNNPFLKNKSFTKPVEATVFDAEGRPVEIIDYNNTMTINGAINKSFILLFVLLASSFFTWYMVNNGQNPYVVAITGGLIGFVMVLIASFKPNYSQYLAPAYALFEGMFIGGISAVFALYFYPEIIMQAVLGTFVTFIVCFLLYRFKIVKVTEQFKSIVVAATFAIASYYLVSWILSLFTSWQPVHHGNSLMSIGISVFVIVIAALNLFLDFDMIEQGAKKRLPKYMEWFSAMGLLITLVWLYLEILRLLAKLSSRD